MFERPVTFDRFARLLIVVASVIGLFCVLYTLEGVLFPFCLAAFFAYFLYPLVRFFQYRLKMKSRAVAILFSFIVVLALLFGLYELVVPPMWDEMGKVNNLIARYIGGSTHVTSIPEALSRFVNRHVDFRELGRSLTQENILEAGKALLPRLKEVVDRSFSLMGSVMAGLLVLLYTFFILLDYEALSGGWVNLLPSRQRRKAAKLVSDVKNSMNRYFRGQAFIAFIVGVLSSIGFLLIGLPMAIAMGLFVGLLTLIPYMKVIALLPTILLTLLKSADTGESFWLLLAYLILVFALVQIIEDTFLVPKIMGKITGLNPAIILLSLSVWGSLLGITGMIIALPVTSLLLAYYRRYRVYKDRMLDRDFPLTDDPDDSFFGEDSSSEEVFPLQPPADRKQEGSDADPKQ